jgi:NlpC/P60 family putative phage cell wall peptidase
MRRGDIIGAARAWLGTPYRHQASTCGAGCDCLGLIRGVWRQLVGPEPVPLPAYRADWRDAEGVGGLLTLAQTLLVPAQPPLTAGQVLVFRLHRARMPRHCGILVAPDRFVHAQEHLGVVEGALGEGWRRRIAGVFEFPGVED